MSLFTAASLIFTFVHIVPSINLTASEAICEAPFCTVHEKGGLPQIQPKLSLQAKNVPWPQNGASAVVEGRRPGRDWCRWRTVPGTYTGTGTHWQCLVPPCVPPTWSAPDSSPAVPRPFLPLAAWQRGPTRPRGSLYHYSAHRPFTPSTPGAAITLRVLGTRFSVPVRKVFKDEFSCQECISLYFCQKFINKA